MKYFSILLLLFLVTACPSDKTADKPEEEAKKETLRVDVAGESITYSSDGTQLEGYIAYDKSKEGKRPGVLVVHEWWGHNDYARKRADDLAKLGYTALAVDMYGEGKTANHPQDAEKFMMEVFNNMSVGEARFNAALELLKQQPTVDPEKIAAIGYCFGGAVVLHMARIGTDLDAVVSFHGVLSSMHTPEPGSVKAKVLACTGMEDPMVPSDQVAAFKKEMEDAGVDHKVVEFEGVKHSFTNPAADKFGKEFGLPLEYNVSADKQSWLEMQSLFNSVFK